MKFKLPMKNLISLYSKFLVFITLLTFIGLSSCKKTATADPNIASIRVVNASPSSATYNAYLNSMKINTVALPFGGSATYASNVAGSYNLKFTTESSIESLFTKQITLDNKTYCSSYLINKPSRLDVYTITDDLSVPSADKAYVRFLNLSPDATAFDLIKTGTATALFTNKSFKNSTGFSAVDAGTYSFDAKEIASGEVRATTGSIMFAAGNHYDIILGGLVTPANDTERPLSLQTILIK